MINDAVFLACGLVIIVIIVTLVFRIEQKKIRKYVEFFQNQAARKNRRFVRSDSFSLPQLHFTYRDIEVVIFMTQLRSGRISRIPPGTFIVADFPVKIDCQFQIYQEADRARIVKPLVAPYMKLQSDPFDEVFMIRSKDRPFVESIFTYEVQQRLLACRAYKPVVEFYQQRLAISVPLLILEEKILDGLVEACRGLIDRIQDIGEHQ